MKYKVKITKEILAKTANRETNFLHRCPIEEAVSDIFPNAIVSLAAIFTGTNGSNEAYRCIALPIMAQKFIEKFDSLSPEERINLPELEFDINIQEEMIENGSF